MKNRVYFVLLENANSLIKTEVWGYKGTAFLGLRLARVEIPQACRQAPCLFSHRTRIVYKVSSNIKLSKYKILKKLKNLKSY